MRFVRTSRYVASASLFVLLLSCAVSGAVREGKTNDRSATRATQAKHAQLMATEAAMTGGGSPAPTTAAGPASRGADLRAIASPKKATTATGFPAGTLPGDGGDTDEEQEPVEKKRVALVGDPLAEPISEADIGTGLNGIATIADHVGYQLLLRTNYRPRSLLEPPYSYQLMQGRRRLKTLFFDHSLKLVSIQ